MAKDNFWNKWFGPKEGKTWDNVFNKAFYQFIGGQEARYDYDNAKYLEKGYAQNPDVFAIMEQRMRKVRSIPFYVKKIKDKKAHNKLQVIHKSALGNYSQKQYVDIKFLENKAYEELDLDFPLPKPNPNQNWTDLTALNELYYGLLGNSYWLKIAPVDGPNKGVPTMMYVLPAHKMKLVLKKDADLMYDENPIDYYLLIEGDQSIRFNSENIIHLKTPNPFFDLDGSHLYGMSPLRPLMLNIESSNESIKNNLKMIKNSGIFGLISGKDAVLTAEQATQIKQKLFDMDKDSGRLSRIAGMSVPVEFTRLSLSADEMKPFDYLKYDQKTICNVLGWYDVLLNNDANTTWNNLKTFLKMAITNTIQPNLTVLQEALTSDFIKLYKGYDDAFIYFDTSELPEMQEDMAELVKWMREAFYTPNEIRIATKAESLEIEGMDSVWVAAGLKRIDEVGITASDVEKSYNYIKDNTV